MYCTVLCRDFQRFHNFLYSSGTRQYPMVLNFWSGSGKIVWSRSDSDSQIDRPDSDSLLGHEHGKLIRINVYFCDFSVCFLLCILGSHELGILNYYSMFLGVKKWKNWYVLYFLFTFLSFSLPVILNNVNLFEIFHLEKENENALNSFRKSDVLYIIYIIYSPFPGKSSCPSIFRYKRLV